MSRYVYVNTQALLQSACVQLRTSPYIAVDTEFIRRNTFYPRLALIQLAAEDGLVFLVDALAPLNWKPLKALLEAERPIKWLYAAGEDVEALASHSSIKLNYFLDFQYITAFLGQPIGLGLAASLHYYLGLKVDKSQQCTNWLRRPLSPEQCLYASKDVALLLRLGRCLQDRWLRTPWVAAVWEEMDLLRERRLWGPTELSAVWKVKGMHACLEPIVYARLAALVGWRLNEARLQNRPVQSIASDLFLVKLAQVEPMLRRNFLEEMLHEMGSLDSLEIWLDRLERVDHVRKESSQPVEKLEFSSFRQQLSEIQLIIRACAQRLRLPAALLGPRDQLIDFVHWKQSRCLNKLPLLLTGWRRGLISDRLGE